MAKALFAAAAALAFGCALSACSEAEAPAPEATDTASAAATETAAAAAPAGAAAFTPGEAPSKEFMVGIWGQAPDCSLPMEFVADGTIKDGPFEKWSLENGTLMMEGAPQKMALKVIDANTMETQIEGNDKKMNLQRC